MSEFLPEAVRKGLEEARKAAQKRSSRLCVHVDDKVYRVLRLTHTGLVMDSADAPRLRGRVEIYDGPRHLYQALIQTSREEHGEWVYDFKWQTPSTDRPAVDYVKASDGPAGYLPSA